MLSLHFSVPFGTLPSGGASPSTGGAATADAKERGKGAGLGSVRKTGENDRKGMKKVQIKWLNHGFP